MPSIDERIVQMEFDNKDFEKNIQVSMKSLEDLKKSLELDKAAKSLENIEKAVENVDFRSMSDSLDQITNRFSAFGEFTSGIFRRLGEQVVDLGEKLIKSLTIDQIKPGQKKYELRTKAVQSIKAALPDTDFETIENVLGDLNKYTDETSYDFAEMANTIGKFVAAGVDLQVAERAMEGIGNEAAKSGAGIQEANRAMYNFAQALATGSVKLMDWKSIENANMATKEFKEQIIETAIDLGKLKKAGDKVGKTAKGTEVNFRTFSSTLNQSWFTSEVLTATLEKYADKTTEFGLEAFYAAQKALTFTDAIQAINDAISTSWMLSFQHMFGNLQEATELWTNFCNAIIEFTDRFDSARNEILETWHTLGGYKAVLEAASNMWNTFTAAVDAAAEALRSIFPSSEEAGEGLAAVSQKLADWTAQIRESYAPIQKWAGKETIVTEFRSKGFEKWEKDLKKGTNDKDAVKLLQERLKNAGYDLARYGADGIYGPETEAAVKALQKDLGLAVTGVYDEATHEAFGKQLGYIGTKYEKVDKYIEETNPKFKAFQTIIQGVASAAKLLFGFLKFGVSVIGKLLGILSPIGELLMEIGGFISSIFTSLNENVNGENTFTRWLEDIDKFLGPAKEAVQGFADTIRKFIFGTEEAPTLLGQLRNGSISLKDAWNKAKESFMNSNFGKALGALLDKIGPGFEKLKEKIANFFKEIKNKLGEKFPGILKSLGDGFSKIGTGLVNFVSKAYDAIKGSEFLQKNWAKLKKFLKGFGDSLGKFGKAAWDAIVGIFEGKSLKDVWDGLKENLGSVGEFFKNTWESIKGWFSGIIGQSDLLSGIFGTIGKVVKPVGNVVKGFIDSLIKSISTFLGTDTSNIEGFWPKLKEKLKGFDSFKDWFVNIKDSIKQAFENVKKLISGEDVEGGGVSGLFTQLTQTLENFGEQFKNVDLAGLLKKAGIAIAIALVIDGLKNIGNLISGFKTFSKALLYKEGGGVGNVVKNIGNALLKAGAAALMMGAGIALVVLSINEMIRIVKETDEKDLEKALDIVKQFGEMFAVVEGVTGIAAGFSHDSGFSLNVGGAIGIAFGLLIFVRALNKLVNLYKTEGLDSEYISKALSDLQLILAEFAVFTTISSFGSGGSGIGQLSGPLGVAWGLKIIVGALADLVKLYKDNSPVDMALAIEGIQELLFELGAINVAAGFTTKPSGMIAGATGAVAAAYALQMIVEAIGNLAKVYNDSTSGKNVDDVILGIQIILGELGAIEIGTGFTKNWAGQLAGATGAVAAAYALQMIVEAIGNLAKVYNESDAENAQAAVEGISGLLLILAGFQVAEGFTTNWLGQITGGGGVIAAAYALKMIAEAFGAVIPSLESVDADRITEFFKGMSIILTSMEVFITAAGKLNTFGNGVDWGKVAGGAIGQGAAGGSLMLVAQAFNDIVKSFGEALGSVGESDIDEKQISAFSKGVEIIMGSMEVFITAAGKLNTFGSGVDWGKVAGGAIGQGAAGGSLMLVAQAFNDIVSVLGDVVPKMGNINPKQMDSFFSGLNGALLAMEGFLTAIAGMSAIPGFSAFKMTGVFVGLSVALALIGSITDQTVNNFSSTLRLVGWRLESFSNSMENVNVDNINKVKDFAESLKTAIGILIEVGTKEDKVNDFNVLLTRLGGSLLLFSLNTIGLNSNTNATLSEMGTKIGELVGSINGIENVDNAVGVLERLGAALNLYFGNTKELNYEEGSEPPVDAIQRAFENLAKAVPTGNEFDTLSNFGKGGEYGDINELALGITNLATALRNYGTKIGTLRKGPIEMANNVLNTVVGIKDHLEGVDSFNEFSGKIANKNGEFEQFIIDIASLGSALGSYADNIGGLNFGKVLLANWILETLSGIPLPETGGVWQWIAGQQDLGKFASNVEDMGRGLAGFGNAIQNVTFDQDKINVVSSLMTALADASSKVPETGGILSWLTGDEDFSKLGTQLGLFSASITDNLPQIQAAPDYSEFENVFKILDQMSTFQERIKLIDYAGDTRTSDFDFSGLSRGLISFLNEMSYIEKDADGLIESAKNVGNSISWAIGQGILIEDTSSIATSLTTVINGLPALANSRSKDIRAIGTNIDKGIAKGIENSSRIVVNAMKTMLSGLIITALQELLINSPSKVFMSMGESIDEGLVKGIGKDSDQVFKSSREVAESSIQGFQNGLQTLNELMALPIDDSPVIRPVLDLSEVIAGAGSMGGLFGDQTMGVQSTSIANAIGRDMAVANRPESISSGNAISISDAITKLNDRLSSLETSISNMKVVTETGALIGQIATGIDDKLGEFAYLTERRG